MEEPRGAVLDPFGRAITYLRVSVRRAPRTCLASFSESRRQRPGFARGAAAGLHVEEDIGTNLRAAAATVLKEKGHHSTDAFEIRGIEDLALDATSGYQPGSFECRNME